MADLKKAIVNGRMLKNNGSWLYCSNCDNTVGYLVYSGYQHFHFCFDCKCGSSGSFELEYESKDIVKSSTESLILIKNRLRCPIDNNPLFTIVEKNLDSYSYSVTCKSCLTEYKSEK